MRPSALLLLLFFSPDSSGLGRTGKTVVLLGEKGAVRMEFVALGPGRFVMGEGADAHTVVLTRPFWIQTTEVTQEQWQAVMGSNPSQHKGDRRPVDHVSWLMAKDFVERLKAFTPGCEPALPTEAEWEYACRAGSRTKWCFGDGPAALTDHAWFGFGPVDRGSFDVGGKKPNVWGLFDMSGNVLEWCEDWFGGYAGDAVDPRGPEKGEKRIVRGGGWYGPAEHTLSAWRYSYAPDMTGQTLGLRVVLR